MGPCAQANPFGQITSRSVGSVSPVAGRLAASGLQIGLQNRRLICGFLRLSPPFWWLPFSRRGRHVQAREPTAWPQPGFGAAADERLPERGRTTASLTSDWTASRSRPVGSSATEDRKRRGRMTRCLEVQRETPVTGATNGTAIV